MSTEVLLPLVVFFALGVPILLLLWRVFVVGGELRLGQSMRIRFGYDNQERKDEK